jgi:hypothetical protein
VRFETLGINGQTESISEEKNGRHQPIAEGKLEIYSVQKARTTWIWPREHAALWMRSKSLVGFHVDHHNREHMFQVDEEVS